MRYIGLSCCLVFALLCTTVQAQTDTKTAQAAVVFDVRMDKVTSSPLGKKLGLKEKMGQNKGDGPDMSKVARIFGGATAPEGMAELQQMQMGGMPIDFFVRFEFVDAEGAKSMLKQAMEDNAGTIEKNGVTYYKAPEAEMPAGVMMYSPSDKVVEIGTEAFAFASGEKSLTNGVKAAWAKVPDEAIRVAIDLKAAEALVKEAVKEGKGQAPPPLRPFIGLLNQMKDMGMSIDLKGNNLMTMKMTGKSSDDSEEIKEAADSLLLMAREGGKMQAKQMEQFDPDNAKMMVTFVEGLNAENNGGTVIINVPKPEGFEDFVGKMVGQFGPMFGMGAPMNDNF